MTRGRLDLSDYVFDTGQRTEPMRRVRQFRSRDTGKEILCATSEAGDFMRHRRAKDQHRVINSGREQLVDTDRYGMFDQSIRQLLHCCSAQFADGYQLVRFVPAVIE